jgi:predicted adenylyl cyclase CyaB
MPRNIELKARLPSLEAARETAQRLATRRLGLLHQVDTYFHALHGRLKLRQIDGRAAELIAYHRGDATEARASDYTIAPISNPETLKQALAAALGVRVVVDKTREVFLYHNVRIHLDQVRELGTFLEFEAVLDDKIDDAAGRAQVEWLCGQFDILPADHVACSYADLKEKG